MNINQKYVNALKIAFAAILSIVCANYLQLDYPVSAGVVAILSVAPTKKETIATASQRFIAFIVALVIAFLCFEIVGYGYLSFYIYLLLFIVVCQHFQWKSAMAVDSVLISHFIHSSMNTQNIGYEILLFLIGISLAMFVNAHLHKDDAYITKMKEETDQQMKEILHRMSLRIVDKQFPSNGGQCFHDLEYSLRIAKNIAETNYMNQLSNVDRKDNEYLEMREKQFHVLYAMHQRIDTMHSAPITAKQVSDLLEEVAQSFHQDNTGELLLEKLYLLMDDLKSSPLPEERMEFEERAKLFVLLKEVETFILLKVEFVATNSIQS